MVNVEYTKIYKIREVNNCMCHNYYYIYYGRIYNEDKTRYRRFKFVEWFDIFDVQEYFEKDYITKDDIREYAMTFCDNSYLSWVKDYNDIKHLKEFYEYCKGTIEDYNKSL